MLRETVLNRAEYLTVSIQCRRTVQMDRIGLNVSLFTWLHVVMPVLFWSTSRMGGERTVSMRRQ